MKRINLLNNMIIPIMIVCVCSLAPLRLQNLTYIANTLPYRWLVFILALIISYNFLSQFLYIFKITHFNQNFVSTLLIFSLFLIPLAVLIPYNLDYPLLTKLHVWISFGGSIIFMVLLNIFLWHLFKTNVTLYQFVLPAYLFLISSCVSLFVWFGSVNSLVEIFFIWGLNYLIYRLNLYTRKESEFIF